MIGRNVTEWRPLKKGKPDVTNSFRCTAIIYLLSALAAGAHTFLSPQNGASFDIRKYAKNIKTASLDDPLGKHSRQNLKDLQDGIKFCILLLITVGAPSALLRSGSRLPTQSALSNFTRKRVSNAIAYCLKGMQVREQVVSPVLLGHAN